MDMSNAAAYVADRIASGWTPADVADYRAEVARINKSGTEDEQRAAEEFWSAKEQERIAA